MSPARPKTIVTLAGIVAICGVAGSAQTTTIRGQVLVPRDVTPLARRPDVRGLGMPPPLNAAPRRQSVVYLHTAPREAFGGRDLPAATMNQRDESFVPHVLAITAGTVVEFPNSDETYHNVFSLSPVRPFDLGRYAAGRSKSVRFDRPGVVRVFCDIHSHMSAFVLVFTHQFFSLTDDDGRFQIDGVPPGSYEVVVWHELLAGQSRQIRIPESGGDVEVDFSLDWR